MALDACSRKPSPQAECSHGQAEADDLAKGLIFELVERLGRKMQQGAAASAKWARRKLPAAADQANLEDAGDTNTDAPPE